jgi:hypothetical protein
VELFAGSGQRTAPKGYRYAPTHHTRPNEETGAAKCICFLCLSTPAILSSHGGGLQLCAGPVLGYRFFFLAVTTGGG